MAKVKSDSRKISFGKRKTGSAKKLITNTLLNLKNIEVKGGKN
jgi:hypothetical protein